MPTSPRRVCLQSGQKNGHDCTVGFRADVGIGPYGLECTAAHYRRGRCPHRPVGCVSGAVRKNGHVHTVSFRADEGHRPIQKNGPFPHCRGRSPDRPAGYDTGAVRKDVRGYPVGIRADEGIGPYEKTCVPCIFRAATQSRFPAPVPQGLPMPGQWGQPGNDSAGPF